MSKVTKLFIDLEDVLRPLQELNYEAVGKLRASATKQKLDKVLIIVNGDIEVEETTTKKLTISAPTPAQEVGDE